MLYKDKVYPRLGLKVRKYSRKVFYKNLWDEELVEYRGLVLDMEDNIVSYPFTKIFNLGENGTTVPADMNVVCPRKVNGFMGVATWHNGELLVSTSGTLDSDFVSLAEFKLRKQGRIEALCIDNPDYTFMFEITDPSDPHIVPEESGAWLIGARLKVLHSELLQEQHLESLADSYGFLRPEIWRGTFKYLPLNVKHEGWMVRCASTGETLCKIKSQYYKFTKFWMRSKKAYKIQDVEEEFFPLVEKIRAEYTEECWAALDQQERRKFIEDNI